MMPSRAFIRFWTCTLAGALAAATTESTALQHDLFARPPLEALKPAQPEPVKTITPAAPPPEWKPELKAVITGGGTAMVNVEGRIVQMGQEMDGYRLVEIQERRATFVKDKVRYTLHLNAVVKADGAAAPKAADAVAGVGSVKASAVLPTASAPTATTGPQAAPAAETVSAAGKAR
jgi:hypothetical protein